MSKIVPFLYVYVILPERRAIIIHVPRLYLSANEVSMILQVSKVIIVLVNTGQRGRVLAAATEVKEGISISHNRLTPAGAGPGTIKERCTKHSMDQDSNHIMLNYRLHVNKQAFSSEGDGRYMRRKSIYFFSTLTSYKYFLSMISLTSCTVYSL